LRNIKGKREKTLVAIFKQKTTNKTPISYQKEFPNQRMKRFYNEVCMIWWYSLDMRRRSHPPS